jgi:hypothetical protein
MDVHFTVHHPDGRTEQLGPDQILAHAQALGLEALVPGRYTGLLVLNLLMLRMQGIDPAHVLSEIQALEGGRSGTGTKPATPFRGPLLRGLWHKHFFAPLPSLLAHNILNHFGDSGLAGMIDQVVKDSASPVFTLAMIEDIAQRATVEPLEQRHAAGKLTGEWVVFGKHEDKNYYLCISTHEVQDAELAARVRICQQEFDGLSWLSPHPNTA